MCLCIVWNIHLILLQTVGVDVIAVYFIVVFIFTSQIALFFCSVLFELSCSIDMRQATFFIAAGSCFSIIWALMHMPLVTEFTFGTVTQESKVTTDGR